MDDTFELTPEPSAWPLLFRHHGPVLGKGFVAVVTMQGRLLARPDGDGIWLDGVNPGALALGADNVRVAGAELRTVLTGIFTDFAEQAESFEAFKAAVVEFFNATDDETVAEWTSCVTAVQMGRSTLPGILPVWTADTPLSVEVTRKSVENVSPKDNPEPEPVLAAVA